MDESFDEAAATFALAALSQSARLEAFRLLVQAEPGGMAAGNIAEALGARQNTMSANLAVLLRAGLVTNSRQGRTITYRANLSAMTRLIRFLMQDCCGGRPELCDPIIQTLTPSATCTC
jgi:DNA-binding transcriptional ArsR family regulator